jgi:hypothetical protein
VRLLQAGDQINVIFFDLFQCDNCPSAYGHYEWNHQVQTFNLRSMNEDKSLIFKCSVVASGCDAFPVSRYPKICLMLTNIT